MEVAMRRLPAVFLAIIFVVPGKVVIAGDRQLKRPTLEAVFDDKALELEELDNLMWLPDGGHVIYWTTKNDKSVLWKQSVTTGETTQLADWTTVLEQLTAQRPEWKKPDPSDVNSSASGRTTPVLSPDGLTLAGGHAGDLFLFELATGKARFLTGDAEPKIFPAFSPDGSRIAFAKNGDVYWLDLASGVVRRVTDRGYKKYLLNGVADWVYEEELDVERAYWWSPDGAHISFLQFDETPVGVVPITGDAIPYPDLEHQWYPKAGTANPVVRLGVVGLDGGEPRWIDTGEGDFYLPRAGWTPSGMVWVQRLNRDQNVLDLMVADPTTGRVRTLVTDTDPAWINVRDDLVFLDDGRFLWTSERAGWRHIYLYGPDGTLEKRLTSGEWQIEKVYGVDGDQNTAFFQGNLGDPRQRHLYRVGLAGGEVATLGNEPRGTHSGALSPDGTLLVDQWSTHDTPPRADLVTADGEVLRRLWESGAELAAWDLLPVEPGSITSTDGTELFTLLVRPRDFDPARRYPVVLYVYGGPHSQGTADHWNSAIHNTYRLFAEMGIATFLVDNRGTWGRGHAFETVVHRRLGEYEVADNLDAAGWLTSQPWVDPDRIAVYGGSYGGYMTLLLMLKAPDVFRAGIAYAPVTDWRLYDTIYTERYMDTPQDNPEGYTLSAPLEYAENLSGALLLAHGAMDNNVHLQNTLQLIGKLAAANKTFEFMIYPRTRHGIRRSRFAPHFHRLKIDFLKRNLLDNPEE